MTTRARAEDNESSDVRGAHGDAASADSVSADLIDILDTVDLPIVAVGRDFTVARFNRVAAEVLGLHAYRRSAGPPRHPSALQT